MRIRLRRPRLLAVGLPVLALICAGNHYEYTQRQNELTRASAVVVNVETGPAGHTTLGIDEKSGSEFLQFSLLGQWPFDAHARTAPPEALRAVNGRNVKCIGFMYPLEPGAKLKTFCLLRSTQTCCYGPRPQYNQYLFAEATEPVAFERLAPVIATGKFVIDPKPEDGYIYRLENVAVRRMDGDEPEPDPTAIAAQRGLPLFDFGLLSELEQTKQISPSMRACDGKEFVLHGSVLDRIDDSPPKLILGKSDATKGTAIPSVFNAVMVELADNRQLPPAWLQDATFSGTLRIVSDSTQWTETGVVRLEKARREQGDAARVCFDAGPQIPLCVEVLAFLALLVLTTWLVPPPEQTPDNAGNRQT